MRKTYRIASNIDLTLNHCATVFQEVVNLKACQAYLKVHLPMAVGCAKINQTDNFNALTHSCFECVIHICNCVNQMFLINN